MNDSFFRFGLKSQHVQARDGQIALDQMRSVDKVRLKKKLGTVDKNTGERIKKVLQTMFS